MSGVDARDAAGRDAQARVEARRLAEAGALLVMVAWAANFVVVKSAIAVVPPVGFAFVRFLIAGLVLLAVLRLREGSVGLPRDLVVRVGLLGALGFGVYQVLWATGLSLTTAGTSALLVGTTPIWTALIAVALGTEAPHPARFGGAVIGLAGVALVVAARGLDLGGSGLADLATLTAAICWGAYLAISAPLLARHSPLRLTTWAILAGSAVLAVPGLAELDGAGFETVVRPEVVVALLYSGIVAAGLANVLIFRAIALAGASRIANLQLLVPALTVLFAAALLGEPILAGQVVGGVVIVAGILIARRAPLGPPPGRRPTPPPPPLLEA